MIASHIGEEGWISDLENGLKASVGFWAPIVERYGIDIRLVNDTVDPTFPFMSLDRDGNVRMDCSSPYAMAPLAGLQDRFDIAFGTILTRTGTAS